MSQTVEIKIDGLNGLLKALNAKPPVARVGILGGKATASHPAEVGKGNPSKDPTTAQVGAAHEFGTSRLPQRSFLRVPISDGIQKELDNSGLLDKDSLNEVVKKGSLLSWVKKMAVLAEGLVADAFDGHNNWKPSNMTHKVIKQTLVETTLLRNSISSEVKE